MEQRQLVGLARRGDGAAFAALVAPDLPAMVRLAAVVSGSTADAEDIVQEALTRALDALTRFDVDRPFRPWFATIVSNQARNWRRSGTRRRRLTLRVANLAPPAPQATDDAAVARVGADATFAALRSMEELDRTVLALRHLTGLSEADTAAALGIAVGTVKSRNARALTRLRTILEEGQSA
jgi:RNA polymerase sigma factor (sigma-70 family)